MPFWRLVSRYKKALKLLVYGVLAPIFKTPAPSGCNAMLPSMLADYFLRRGSVMAYETFYDRNGRAVAWYDNEQEDPAIYLYNGTPVAWISDESIYGYSGRHFGWFIDGWVRDSRGQAVLFTAGSTGGPARPARNACPARAARSARPARGARQARPARPARSLSWSVLSGEAFFTQQG